MNISAWLDHAIKQLREIGVDSARLDAELILANTLRKNRTYLHAHPEDDIDPRQHGAIIAYAGSRQLRHKLTRGFIVVLQA